MAEEKKERWLNYLALTTVVLAVCSTLSTFRGSSFSTRAVISQSQAANQWAYFQAKSMKGYLYELQKEELETDLPGDGERWSVEKTARYRGLLERYAARIARYATEENAIQTEARRLEKVRDHAQSHSQSFGIAVIFLQIAILLSSISALMKKKPLWALGLGCGVVGLFYFAVGLIGS